MNQNTKSLNMLEKQINVEFKNKAYLKKSMTHKSYANENRHKKAKPNERLEFLGDAVLNLVISEYIFKRYPNYPEGELAKTRAVVVSSLTLARISKRINLGQFLLLGKGEEMTGGRERDSILADVFEALLGGIYLDQGLEVAREFIHAHLIDEILSVERGEHIHDYKTLLQEEIQKRSNTRPIYQVASEEGPDHNKQFDIEVEFSGKIIGKGTGKSKKDAQQKAAEDALQRFERMTDL
ncbi:MAG: ribonuclease III [Halanaerobiales bacterium]|nr:ribonuclease III [Halanaerobiales bacterium]